MYTKCPECNAVFEITAADLAVAGGFVRCGQCSASFDALNSLSDSSGALQATPEPEGQPDGGDALTSEAASGEEEPRAIEPDAIADQVQELATDSDATKAEIVELDTGADEPSPGDNDDALADEAMAGDASEAETDASDESIRAAQAVDLDDDEILLDEHYEPPLIDEDEEFFDDEDDDILVADEDETDRLAAGEADSPGPEDQAETTDEDEVDESALFALPLPELTALEPPEHGTLPEKLEGGEAAHDPSAQSQASAHAKETSTDAAVSKPAMQSPWLRTNDAYDAEDARDLRNYLRAPDNPRATIAWIAGTVVMALLLVGQIIHRHRGDLVIHPRFGPVVQSLYKTVGVDLRPNWQIGEYEVVGQTRLFLMPLDGDEDPDATEGTAANGDPNIRAIRFVAIISNGATLPQPAPLVRLTLRDRWGDATGARTFTPPEYLADRTMIGRLLEPGQRLRIVLNMYDFGADAVGFDFDMCLPDDAGTLRCAHDG